MVPCLWALVCRNKRESVPDPLKNIHARIGLLASKRKRQVRSVDTGGMCRQLAMTPLLSTLLSTLDHDLVCSLAVDSSQGSLFNAVRRRMTQSRISGDDVLSATGAVPVISRSLAATAGRTGLPTFGPRCLPILVLVSVVDGRRRERMVEREC
jgi:hypothetical protein